MAKEMQSATIKAWFDECQRRGIAPWNYDFKEQLTSSDPHAVSRINKELNPLKRLLIFWQEGTRTKLRKPNRITLDDVESTALAKEIYSILWDIDSVNTYSFDRDVMNSVWASYKFSINLRYDSSFDKDFISLTKLIDNYDNYIEVNNSFKKFAAYTHTIGNFIIETKGFNRGRSNNDYWDLALVQIKNYFNLIDKSTWEKYIRRMYLQPFVTSEYKIVGLWDRHLDPSTTVNPADNGNELSLITQFIGHACTSIENRGKAMVKRLCEKQNLTQYEFYEPKLRKMAKEPAYSSDLWKSKRNETSYPL